MLNIIIFGAPGSGKGTQSENLITRYNLAHISTGDVLRAEIKNGTELGKLAEEYISKGQLVPDDVVIGMLANVLDSKKIKQALYSMVFQEQSPKAKLLKKY
jgi:Adenylate kinase (EC 2.7.4.3)